MSDPTAWLITCSQLVEAVSYLHDDVHILPNDIKTNNILLSEHQVVLTDFGKVSSGRRYNLSVSEKAQYLRKFPHVAPEVVQRESRQTTHSDIYAVGVLFSNLLAHDCFFSLSSSPKNDFASLSEKCKASNYRNRPTSKQ